MKQKARRLYIRRNNKKLDFIEKGCIVIANLLLWSDLEQCIYTTLFYSMMIKSHRHYLIYKYKFTCSIFWTTRKLTRCVRMTSILVERAFEKYRGQIYSFDFDTYFLRILIYYANKTIHFGKYTLYRNLIPNINMCMCEFV